MDLIINNCQRMRRIILLLLKQVVNHSIIGLFPRNVHFILILQSVSQLHRSLLRLNILLKLVFIHLFPGFVFWVLDWFLADAALALFILFYILQYFWSVARNFIRDALRWLINLLSYQSHLRNCCALLNLLLSLSWTNWRVLWQCWRWRSLHACSLLCQRVTSAIPRRSQVPIQQFLVLIGGSFLDDVHYYSKSNLQISIYFKNY